MDNTPQQGAPAYSVIVPVFNRPDEVDELLGSLCRQQGTRFEVVVVEDGSRVSCEEVCQRYADRLDLHYFPKENGGPGPARNYGAGRSAGRYLIILDSDVVLPDGYFAAIDAELTARPCEAFGGPDRAHDSFTPVQKAINYAMTSFFTTGGIRGGKQGGASLDRFFPRSFNMGVRRDVYESLGGFAAMRFGEDVDFSYRIVEGGHSCRLFPEAWVWHKRRADLRKFFRQVHNSGIARINLSKRHPGTLKAVHVLPALFTVGVAACLLSILTGVAACLLSGPACPWTGLAIGGLTPLILFSAVILTDSASHSKSLKVGLLSVAAAFVQLTGYGSGFLRAWWRRCVRGKGEFEAFKANFYK